MDEAIVAQTQEIFGALIKKPKMTAKLLNKPPFRFLHDVFSETSKATGFAEGLYEGDELQAGSIKVPIAAPEFTIGFELFHTGQRIQDRLLAEDARLHAGCMRAGD